MNPLSSTAWGSKASTSRLSFYVGLQIASVVVPGIVVAGEIAALVVRFNIRRDDEISIVEAVENVSGIKGPGLVLILVIGISAGCIVGWISREVGFQMVGAIENRTWFKKLGSQAENDVEHLPLPERLGLQADAAIVGSCIERHPVIGEDDYEAFVYCKFWLRAYAPDMSVDSMEVDINVLAASLIPILLAAANGVAWSESPALVTGLVVPAVAALSVLIVNRIIRKRRAERWEAVRNVLHDHMMRTALSHYDREAVAETLGGDG